MALALVALPGTLAAQTPALPVPAVPVEVPAEAPPATAKLSDQELEQLVAPIALYPDPVLADILAASTNPAQVVEAARFVAANGSLDGEALASAAAEHHWDPSVQALVAFPSVLHMLDGNLEWTDQLGRAFMSQQSEVMDAIQRLRLAAERTGALQNGPDSAVVNAGGAVTINSPSAQTIYLPTYDAGCVYGGGGAGCAGPAGSIGWDSGVLLPYGYGSWLLVDWNHRCIRHNHDDHGAWRGGPSGSDWAIRAAASSQPGAVWRPASPGFGARPDAPGIDRFIYVPRAGNVPHFYGTTAPASGHFAPSVSVGSAGASHAHFAPIGAAPRGMAVAPLGIAPGPINGHR